MFQFTGLASTRLWIQRRNIRASRDQRSFVNSPGLIADFHALHRLLMPRHPPCALISLTTNIHCSQTSASPLQVALFLSFFLAPLPPADARRSGSFIRRCHLRTKNQIVKDHLQAQVEPPLALRPVASPKGKAEFIDAAACCQQALGVFSNFFSKPGKRSVSPFHRQPPSSSLTAVGPSLYRTRKPRQLGVKNFFSFSPVPRCQHHLLCRVPCIPHAADRRNGPSLTARCNSGDNP
jgi:hypothetical protein